jgi:hypothetical protein
MSVIERDENARRDARGALIAGKLDIAQATIAKVCEERDDARQQLTRAVDLLREIAESDPVDNALDPGRNVRIAASYFAPSTTTGGQ